VSDEVPAPLRVSVAAVLLPAEEYCVALCGVKVSVVKSAFCRSRSSPEAAMETSWVTMAFSPAQPSPGTSMRQGFPPGRMLTATLNPSPPMAALARPAKTMSTCPVAAETMPWAMSHALQELSSGSICATRQSQQVVGMHGLVILDEEVIEAPR